MGRANPGVFQEPAFCNDIVLCLKGFQSFFAANHYTRPPQSLLGIVLLDKDHVLKLIPTRHKEKLDKHEIVYATGYRRTRHGEQQLELRFDGIAGCLRTPEGGNRHCNCIAHRFVAVVIATRKKKAVWRSPIKYVDFLNAWNQETTVDFDVVEKFWAEQIREYFRNQPFVLTADTSKTIGANKQAVFVYISG